MKYLSYGDSIEDDYNGLEAEMLVTNDKVSARDLNRPSLNLYENGEEVYNILQSAIKTIYGNKNGIVPDVYEEFNAKNIFLGSFDSFEKYIRVPTGLAYLADISNGKIGEDSGTPYESGDILTKSNYQADKFHSLSIMNRPNINLFERELASLINLDMTDLNNDIKVYDSIGPTGLMRYYAKISSETSSGSLENTYLPNIAENTKFNVNIPESESTRYIGLKISDSSGNTVEKCGIDSDGAVDTSTALEISGGSSGSVIASNLSVWIRNNMSSVTCEKKLFSYPYYHYENVDGECKTNYIGFSNTPDLLGLYRYDSTISQYILADSTYKFGDTTYYTYDENTGLYSEYTYSSPSYSNNCSVSVGSIPTSSQSYENGVEIKCSSDDTDTTNEYSIAVYVFDESGKKMDATVVYERIRNEAQKYYNSVFTFMSSFMSKFKSSITAQSTSIGGMVTLEPIIPIKSLLGVTDETYKLFYNKNYSSLDSTKYSTDNSNRFGFGSDVPSGCIELAEVYVKYTAGNYSVDYDKTTTSLDKYDRKTISTKEADLNKLVVDTKTELFNSFKFANKSSDDTISIDASDTGDKNLLIKSPYTMISTLGSTDKGSFINIGSSSSTDPNSNSITISNVSDSTSNKIVINSLSTVQSAQSNQLTIQSKTYSNEASIKFTGPVSTGSTTYTGRGSAGFDSSNIFTLKGSGTLLTINKSEKVTGMTQTDKLGTVYFNLIGSTDGTWNIGYPYSTSGSIGTRFNYIVGATGEFGHMQVSSRNMSQHEDSYSGALDLNNQNIYGASSLYIAPYDSKLNSNSNNQTINFSITDGTSSYVDTICSDKKNMYFVVGRTYGSNPNKSIKKDSTIDASNGYCQLILGSTCASVRNLFVQEASTVTGGATFNSTVDVTGVLTASTNVLIGGALEVTGGATFNSTVDVTEVLTASTNVLIGGALGVTGGATFNSTVNVTGTVTYCSNITAYDYSTDSSLTTKNQQMIYGRCAYSDNIFGGEPGYIPYQSGVNGTTFLAPPSEDDRFLSYSTGSTAPAWVSASNISAGSLKHTLSFTTGSTYNTPSTSSFNGLADLTIYIPDQALGTESSVTFSSVEATTLKTSSKRSLKKNIKAFKKSALDIIDGVNVVSYNYKTENKNADTHVGFIADDTDELLSGKMHDSMQLANCIGVLIKAVQELNDKLNERRKE